MARSNSNSDSNGNGSKSKGKTHAKKAPKHSSNKQRKFFSNKDAAKRRRPPPQSRRTATKTSASSSPYASAANVLNEIWTTSKGLKTVTFSNDGQLKVSKSTYAQCANVLKYKHVLDDLLVLVLPPSKSEGGDVSEGDQLLGGNVKNQGLFYVLMYELLLGPNHAIRGGGSLKRRLMKAESQLRAGLERMHPSLVADFAKRKSSTGASQLAGQQHKTVIPRYVRINTLVTTTAEVVRKLRQDHPDLQIYIDEHVPDMIVLEPSAKSRELLQPFVASHQIVLQDKSSCFSALCVAHGYGGASVFHHREQSCHSEGEQRQQPSSVQFIDACAAPGNKTSHLAALLSADYQRMHPPQPSPSASRTSSSKKRGKQKNEDPPTLPTPTIHALDRSASRFEMLERRMSDLVPPSHAHSATKNSSTTQPCVRVRCHLGDFLETTTDEFPDVKCIMLDPSCSGSGMAAHRSSEGGGSAAFSDGPAYSDDRVASLARFQLKALQHAMSQFPSLRRIVYSTCSLYAVENEQVVANALASSSSSLSSSSSSTPSNGWELVSPACLKGWNRRGLDGVSSLTTEQTQSLIRVNPLEDATNGFFVACFQRRSDDDAGSSDHAGSTEAEEVTSMAAAGSWNDDIRRRRDHLGIPIYNGEFDASNSAESDEEKRRSMAETAEMANGVVDESDSNNEQHAAGDEAGSPISNRQQNQDNRSNNGGHESGNRSKNKHGHDGGARNADKAKQAMTKKRAKKLEWKKRQAEQKKRRLLAKAQDK